LKVIKDYLQIGNGTISRIRSLKEGEFYFRGNFVEKSTFAKVKPVITTHTGATPKLKAPRTAEFKKVLAELKKGIKPQEVTEEEIKKKTRNPFDNVKIDTKKDTEIEQLSCRVRTLKQSNAQKDVMIESLRGNLDQYAKYKEIIEPLKTIVAKLGVNGSQGAGFDEEYIVERVLKRIPKSIGGVTYEVKPLEKLRHDFLEETKNKILSDINELSDNAKRMLKYLESRGKGVKSLELEEKCFFMKHSGASSKKVSEASLKLRSIGAAKKDTAGWHKGVLKAQIKEYLGNHEAIEQDIDNLYSHILMSLLGEKKNES